MNEQPSEKLAATHAVLAAYEKIASSERDDLWISLLDSAEALRLAALVDASCSDGEVRPLVGMVVGVKDNIDVSGLPTTAACPDFSYMPEESAPVVATLQHAGAVVLGKTNMDQFATGLVGTRSPYGKVACVSDANRISGGSSSGSAVAVALGIVDVALGTDTAGSGRVPAALNDIVGVKPTRGLLSAEGVVPACESLDCVSIFARSVSVAASVLEVLSQERDISPEDPYGRSWPADAPCGSPPSPVVAVPEERLLSQLDADRSEVFEEAVAKLGLLGYEVRRIDTRPITDVGTMLYQGAFVAERYSAVGEFIDSHPASIDPAVKEIISGSRERLAHELFTDISDLAVAKVKAFRALSDCDLLMLPTVAEHPTFEEVEDDPLGVNTRLGAYTNFCNLLDMAAISVPSGKVGNLPTGITFFGRAFSDRLLMDVAAEFLGEDPLHRRIGGNASQVVVVGAHLTGQPLNGQLTSVGGRLVRTGRTSPKYRLHALKTDPPKPGLERVDHEGSAIEIELWELPDRAFANFVAAVAPPLAIGQVELADGSSHPGFVVTPIGLHGSHDITSHGGWREYLSAAGNP